jgi:antitoxin component YwqK of YwqJK toxin-antitoxin module
MLHRLLFVGLPAVTALILGGCDKRSAEAPAEEEVVRQEQSVSVDTEPLVYTSAADAEEAGVIDPAALPAGSVWTKVSGIDGKVVGYGYLCDDKPVGFWTYFHGNGRVSMQGSYRYGGVEHGDWQLYYDNGRPEARGTYHLGQRHGSWESWHRNGKKAGVGPWQRGKRHGCWRTWHDNGKISAIGDYRHDRKTGMWFLWNDHGRRLQDQVFNHPGTDFPEGKLTQVMADGYKMDAPTE